MSLEEKCKFCPHCNEYISKSGYYAHRNKFYDVDRKLWNLVKPTKKKQRTLSSSSESDCELQTALEEMNSTSVPSQSSWKTDVSKLVVSILWSDCWTANFH